MTLFVAGFALGFIQATVFVVLICRWVDLRMFSEEKDVMMRLQKAMDDRGRAP